MDSAPPTRVFSVSEMIIEADDESVGTVHSTSVILCAPNNTLAESSITCSNHPDAILTSMTNAAIREDDCEITLEEGTVEIETKNSEQNQHLCHDKIPQNTRVSKTTTSRKVVEAKKNYIGKHLDVSKQFTNTQSPVILHEEMNEDPTLLDQQDKQSSQVYQQANFSRRTRKPTQKMAEFICRLCEQNSYKLVKIFGTQGIQLKLADKIHFHLPVQVKASDNLPLGVCMSCINALNVCNDLYQKSLSTDSRLRKIFLNESHFKLLPIDCLQTKNSAEAASGGIPSASQNFNQVETNIIHTPIAQSILPPPKRKDSKNAGRSISQPIAKIKNVELPKKLVQDNCVDSGEADMPVTSADEENWWSQDSEKEDSLEDLTNVTCDLCSVVFSSHGELSKHRKTHPPEERLKCPDCGKIMADDSKYQAHRKIHTSNVHPCSVCGKILASSSGLRVHRLIHENPKFCCQICGKTSRTSAQLQTHMASHSGERPFSCKICGQSFKIKNTLKQHSLTHNERGKFVCDICGHAVNRRSHLKLHMKSHESRNYKLNPSHSCSLCILKFRSNKSLMRHRVIVHGEEDRSIDNYNGKSLNFECRACGTKFANPDDYGTHIKMCAKMYQCGFCELVLRSKRSLEYHLRGHTGEKPFPCKFCEQLFKSEPSRDVHERVHTGERPYQCKKCDKAFRSITNLYQHKAIHDAERKYACSYCQYKTHRPAALKVHLRVHTNEKPYTCEICGKSYKASWDLKLHAEIHNPSGATRQRRVRQKPKTKDQNLILTEAYESGDSTDAVMQLL